MAGFTNIKVDYQGMGRYLADSPELQGALLAHAEVGVRFAKSIAPVGPARDPHRGQFRDSIHAEPSTTGSGRRTLGARIVADQVYPEFGRKHRARYSGAHTLCITGQFLNSPKRSA